MIYLKVLLVSSLITVIFATTNYSVISQGKRPDKRPNDFDTFRLPNETIPLTYDVNIRTWIHEANFTFTGSVRIGILAVQSTNSITLHHRELSIENVRVFSEAGDTIAIGDTSYDSQFEFFTIFVLNELTQENQYFIEIDFSGTMLTTWVGFYAISYINSEGNVVYYASTQLEATDARRAFPCYDELSKKSNFIIRLTHDPSYSAISNMPTTSLNPTPNPDGSVTTEFQQTPPTSPSLIAFHVSDFSYAYDDSVGSIPHRIFTRPHVVNLTSMALRNNVLMLDAFSEYFQVNYPLPKMDAASLPEFGGAMENFGLITYSDYYMLFDDNIDVYEKQITSLQTIAHEQSHQWFGNLVTPVWWTYTWMKEGFATLFQHYGIDLIYPDWNMSDYMLVTTVHNMFRFEADYMNNRPMTHYVEHPDDINSLFDNVSYSKAGSVLRMFLLAFGQETFMSAVRSFLNTNAFSVVTEENLFNRLAFYTYFDPELSTPQYVEDVLMSWTRQAGYPLVTVTRNYQGATDQITLSQARYFYPTHPDQDNIRYWIPYNYATPNNPTNHSRATGWISYYDDTVTITVDSLGASDYFLLDTHGGGYYRIIYDERNYRLISDAMVQNSNEFRVTSKASLLFNVYEFFNTGELTLTTVMDVLRILENEVNYVAWYPVQNLLLELDRIFSVHQNHDILREFIRSLVEDLYDSVRLEDMPNEPVLRKPARQLAVNLACNVGSVHCRSDAVRSLRQLIETGGEFHQNIRTQMYCAALRSANANDFNFVWNRMLTSQNPNQRNELSQSLGCLTSRIHVNRLLNSLLPSTNGDNIEYQPNEPYRVFRSIYENEIYGLDLTLDFVIENAVETFETFGNFLHDMAPSVRRIDIVAKYHQLLDIYLENGLIDQSTVVAVEGIIAANQDLFEERSELINQWLLDNFA